MCLSSVCLSVFSVSAQRLFIGYQEHLVAEHFNEALVTIFSVSISMMKQMKTGAG